MKRNIDRDVGREETLTGCKEKREDEAMPILAPSILSADFSKLGEEIRTIEQAGADYVHIDVMDGCFVPNLSFGIPVMKSIRKITNLTFDVHLMIDEPLRYLEEFADAGADIINVHVEACGHLNRTIRKIHELSKVAGVSLNPATPLTVLDYILEEVDIVQIMSVNPGFSNQPFIESSLRKVSELKSMIINRGLNVQIEVDGGVGLNNCEQLLKEGADILVAGSAVFRGDAKENVKAFKEVFRKCS